MLFPIGNFKKKKKFSQKVIFFQKKIKQNLGLFFSLFQLSSQNQ